MLSLFQQILGWLQSGTSKLLVLAGSIFLITGILSPVGTLVWWINEGAENLGFQDDQEKDKLNLDNLPEPTSGNKVKKINCYIIFLPGVGDFSSDELTPGEEVFLNRLEKLHPNCVTVRDVFPYSAANEDLGGQRLLAPVWRAINEGEGWLKNAEFLIQIRNLWRFAISADERYGPVYNQGIAFAVVDRMNAAHPISQSSQPINLIMIGTSGGAQVALGAASYLNKWLNADLTVVSVGGSFDGNSGFEAISHLYHLEGDRDWVEDITRFVFASRWPLTVASPFNQAIQEGRYTVVNTGLHTHDGANGYFSTQTVGNNTTYVELTLQKVNELPIWSNSKK
jgi:hypothetical protein